MPIYGHRYRARRNPRTLRVFRYARAPWVVTGSPRCRRHDGTRLSDAGDDAQR